jgi:hypothetical protein
MYHTWICWRISIGLIHHWTHAYNLAHEQKQSYRRLPEGIGLACFSICVGFDIGVWLEDWLATNRVLVVLLIFENKITPL